MTDCPLCDASLSEETGRCPFCGSEADDQPEVWEGDALEARVEALRHRLDEAPLHLDAGRAGDLLEQAEAALQEDPEEASRRIHAVERAANLAEERASLEEDLTAARKSLERARKAGVDPAEAPGLLDAAETALAGGAPEDAAAHVARVTDLLDFSGTPKEARRRLDSAAKRVRYAQERGGDTGEAEKLLQQGEDALEAGDLPRARVLASEARQAAEDARKHAWCAQLIANADRKLQKAEDRGADVAPGRGFIADAQEALEAGLYADVQEATRRARDFAERARRTKVAEDSIRMVEKTLEEEAAQGSDVSEAHPLLEEARHAAGEAKFGAVPKILRKATKIAEEARQVREAREALEALESDVEDLKAMEADASAAQEAAANAWAALEDRAWPSFRKQLRETEKRAEEARRARERELVLSTVEKVVERAGAGAVSALGARELLEDVEKAFGQGQHTDIDTLIEAKFEAEAAKKENALVRAIAELRSTLAEMKVAGLETQGTAGLLDEAEEALRDGDFSGAEELLERAREERDGLSEALEGAAARAANDLRTELDTLASQEITVPEAEEYASRAEEVLVEDPLRALDLARSGLEACRVARSERAEQLVEDAGRRAELLQAAEGSLTEARDLAALLDRADVDPRPLNEALRRAEEALDEEAVSALQIRMQVVEEFQGALRATLESRIRDQLTDLEGALDRLQGAEGRDALREAVERVRTALDGGALREALETMEDAEAQLAEAPEDDGEGATLEELGGLSARLGEVKRVLDTLRAAGIDVADSREQFQNAQEALSRDDAAAAATILSDLEETTAAVQELLARAARDFTAAARLQVQKATKTWGEQPDLETLVGNAEELLEEERYADAVEVARLAERKTRSRTQRLIEEAHGEVADQLADYRRRVDRLRALMTDMERADIAIQGSEEAMVKIEAALDEADFETVEGELAYLEEVADGLRQGLEVAAHDLLGVVEEKLERAEEEGLEAPRARQVLTTAQQTLQAGRNVEVLEYCKVIEDIVDDVRSKAALQDLRERVTALQGDLDSLREKGLRWKEVQSLLEDVDRAAVEGDLERGLHLARGLEAVLEDLQGSEVPMETESGTLRDVEGALQTLQAAHDALASGESRSLGDLLTEARLQLGEDSGTAAQTLLHDVREVLEVAETVKLSVEEARAVFAEAEELLSDDPAAAVEALAKVREMVRVAAQDLPEEDRPAIILDMPEEGLEENRWTRFQIAVRNPGDVPVREVTLHIRGDVEVRDLESIQRLEPGEHRTVEADVKPRVAGEVPLDVKVGYRGFLDDQEVLASEQRTVVASPRGTYVVEDAFLVHGDGRLIHHDTRKPEAEIDEDIFSGMLTVVQDFVQDSFRQRTNLGLRRLEFGDSKILIERGTHVYLAAVVSGEEPDLLPLYMMELINEIERRFEGQLEEWSGLLSELEGIREIVGNLLYFTVDQDVRGPYDTETVVGSAVGMIRGAQALGLDVSDSEAALQAAQEALQEDTERAWALVQDAVEKALTSQQDLQQKLGKAIDSLESDLQDLDLLGIEPEVGVGDLERARQAFDRGDYHLAARMVTSLDETLTVMKEEVVAEQIGSTMNKLAVTLQSLESEGVDTSEPRAILAKGQAALAEGRLGEVVTQLEEADRVAQDLRRQYLLDQQREELERIRDVYEDAAAEGLVSTEVLEVIERAENALERGDMAELEVLLGLAREGVLAPLESGGRDRGPRLTIHAPPATLQEGTWTRYEIEVANRGERPARNVTLEAGQGIRVQGVATLDRLEEGEIHTLVMGLAPEGEGDLAADLQLSYQRPRDGETQSIHYLRDFRVAPPDTYPVEDVLLFHPDGSLAAHESRVYREDDLAELGPVLAETRAFLGDGSEEGPSAGLTWIRGEDRAVLLERGEHGSLAAVVRGEAPSLLPLYLLQGLLKLEETFGPDLAKIDEGEGTNPGLRRILRQFLWVTDQEDAELGPLARNPLTRLLLYALPAPRRRDWMEDLLPELEAALGRGLAEARGVLQSALQVTARPASETVEVDDASLKEYIQVVKEIDQAVRKARGKAGLEFHWPIPRLAIRAKSPNVAGAASAFKSMILSHANAQELDVLQPGEIWKGVDLKMTIHKEVLARSYASWARKIELILQSQDPWKIKQGIEKGRYTIGIEGQTIDVGPEIVTFQAVVPPHIVAQEFPDGMVFLDTRLTLEAEAEGFANEIVRIVFEARKDLELDESVPVEIRLVADDKLRRLVGQQKQSILREAHARDLAFVDDPGEQGFVADVEIAQAAFTIAVVPAS